MLVRLQDFVVLQFSQRVHQSGVQSSGRAPGQAIASTPAYEVNADVFLHW